MTPSRLPPPSSNFCLYPPPVLRCFWKDPLMTPPPPPTSSILHYYPLPIHHLFPPKNFDHTHAFIPSMSYVNLNTERFSFFITGDRCDKGKMFDFLEVRLYDKMCVNFRSFAVKDTSCAVRLLSKFELPANKTCLSLSLYVVPAPHRTKYC